MREPWIRTPKLLLFELRVRRVHFSLASAARRQEDVDVQRLPAMHESLNIQIDATVEAIDYRDRPGFVGLIFCQALSFDLLLSNSCQTHRFGSPCANLNPTTAEVAGRLVRRIPRPGNS